MTASKNARLATAGGGAGGAGRGSSAASATSSDGDYRLTPHELLSSPTTSYQVPNRCHTLH